MSHRASLDVSATVLKAVTGWIARRRRRPGSRPGQRAGTVHTQVALLLRWLRHRLDLRTLAADAQLSIATAYRYLHEALDVVAAHAPDLSDVLARARRGGQPFVCLDGTLVPTDRVAARAERGHHLWYSGKHHAFGGNVQVIFDPTGFPLWVSEVCPGSTHDLTAARELVLPALYPHAARARGQGLHRRRCRRPRPGQAPARRATAHRQPLLQLPDHRATCADQRANALLGRWRALGRVTVCPQRIGAITAAALVLLHHEHGRTT